MNGSLFWIMEPNETQMKHIEIHIYISLALGFHSHEQTWKHCELEHHSWAEAAKRTLWEAEQLEAMPLLPPDKRRIIQNFTNALIYSKPAEGHFGRDRVCMRQRVGCVTCAKVSWIENCFPCFLFQSCPDELRPQAHNDVDSSETEASEDESAEEEVLATEQRRGRLLKNEKGYYVLDAHAINELLDVNKYIEAWPQIPVEELHASSIQHPSYPKYRWLLNTRRVPVQASSSDSAATEHGLPKCAGMGFKDRPLWLITSTFTQGIMGGVPPCHFPDKTCSKLESQGVPSVSPPDLGNNLVDPLETQDPQRYFGWMSL